MTKSILVGMKFKTSFLIPYLKWIVTIVLLLLISYQLFRVDDYNLLTSHLSTLVKVDSVLILLFTILIMPFNWIFEAQKWQILLKDDVKITLLDAVKTVLAGIALGFVTPAKLGDYGARAFFHHTIGKKKIVVATLYSSLAQNICNLGFGIGFGYYFLNSNDLLNFKLKTLLLIWIILQLFMMAIVYSGLIKKVTLFNLWKDKLNSKLSSFFDSLYTLTKNAQIKILGLSAIRYFTYVLQFYLVLSIWVNPTESFLIFCAICFVFLMQSIIPLPSILGLVVRSEIAILVFGALGISINIALLSSLIIWCINLLIPTLIGVFVIHKYNYDPLLIHIKNEK